MGNFFMREPYTEAKSPSSLMKALRMKKGNAPTKGRWDVFWSNADRPTMRYDILRFTPETGQWHNSKEKADVAVANYRKYQAKFESRMSLEEYSGMTGIADYIRRIPNGTGKNGGVQHWVAPSDTSLRTSNWTDIPVNRKPQTSPRCVSGCFLYQFIVTAYYEIGHMIVKREQQGQMRAKYGSKLIKGLSKYLTEQYGRGFSAINLQSIRKFYQVYSPSI